MKIKKHNPIRRRLSCPECGFIFKSENGDSSPSDKYIIKGPIKIRNTYNLKDKDFPKLVKCPRCETATPWDEFWESNYGKWGCQVEDHVKDD
jgi:uncharacterized C2H2 Zn-finger protein